MFPKDILKETKLGQTTYKNSPELEPKYIIRTKKYHWSQQISPEPKNITRTKKYQWSHQISQPNHFGKISPGRSQGPADPAVAPYQI